VVGEKQVQVSTFFGSSVTSDTLSVSFLEASPSLESSFLGFFFFSFLFAEPLRPLTLGSFTFLTTFAAAAVPSPSFLPSSLAASLHHYKTMVRFDRYSYGSQ
jgi:hypothetical protein